MTVKYEILKRLVKAVNIKKMWDLSAEEIVRVKKEQNAKTKIPRLTDPGIRVYRIDVTGFPVLVMEHKQKTDRANLFIIGGGMVSAPRPGSVKKALKIAKESGLDLYIPYYPLCTEYPLTKAYEMIHATYLKMLERYAPENVSVLGTSSGGNLALGLAAYINAEGLHTPMPGHIIPISPGTCPLTDEEKRRMDDLDEKDVAIPKSYMYTAETIMRCGDDSVPEYMIRLQTGDFTGCPFVSFIYGSDETLFAFAPSFEAAMKRYGVKYRMIVGEGMFHCYPVFPIVKEAKEGWRQMIALLQSRP